MNEHDPMPADPEQARKMIEDMLTDRLMPGNNKAILVALLLHTSFDGELVHLGRDGGDRGVCGIMVNPDHNHVSSEHNDITCPLCYIIHEATCAQRDDESEYFGCDIDSIMATTEFVDNCLRNYTVRLKSGAGDAM